MVFAHPNTVNRDIADMNITPLVDVMLVLLVIFMIAAPAMTHSLGWELPQIGPVPPTPPKVLNLQVQSGDVLALEGQAISRRDLSAALALAVARDPDLVVKVQVDPAAEYVAAVTAMATARNAGVENLSVLSR
jgi:biopolymer transport protein ExbD/biopolymer transport protein TolR